MKITLTLSLLLLGATPALPNYTGDYDFPRYYSISTTPEDIVSMTARSISPTQLEVQLTNSSSLDVRLYTAGKQIRTLAKRSYILHKGKKTIVKVPYEISIPAGQTTTFRLDVPQGIARHGSTLVYNTISLLTNLKGLNEGDFSLRATISR